MKGPNTDTRNLQLTAAEENVLYEVLLPSCKGVTKDQIKYSRGVYNGHTLIRLLREEVKVDDDAVFRLPNAKTLRFRMLRPARQILRREGRF